MNLLRACVHVVDANGLRQEREAELLRTIAGTLDCPIPSPRDDDAGRRRFSTAYLYSSAVVFGVTGKMLFSNWPPLWTNCCSGIGSR